MERKRDKDRNRKTEKYRNIHRKTETGRQGERESTWTDKRSSRSGLEIDRDRDTHTKIHTKTETERPPHH